MKEVLVVQDNINKVITNALNVDKTNMNENIIKDLSIGVSIDI